MGGSVEDENEGKAFARDSVEVCPSAAEILVFPDAIDPKV